MLVVGPEGGLSDGEVAALTAAGATAVRLGPTVLRTSTAAAVALGAIGVLTDRWTPARSNSHAQNAIEYGPDRSSSGISTFRTARRRRCRCRW